MLLPAGSVRRSIARGWVWEVFTVFILMLDVPLT